MSRTLQLIEKEYFEWLYNLVQGQRYSKEVSYCELLRYLHSIKFRYTIAKDRNRAEDGRDLRYRFAITNYRGAVDTDLVLDVLEGPCSVLEMLVALSLRCEETIMDDPHIGNRTAQWFWGMISNLGLSSMQDCRFDAGYVDHVINVFLDRKYEPNGRGGLFTVRHCHRDLRRVEIWNQLNYYLDEIT